MFLGAFGVMVKLGNKNYVSLGVNMHLLDFPYQLDVVCNYQGRGVYRAFSNVGKTVEKLEKKVESVLLEMQKKLKELPPKILIGSLNDDVSKEVCLGIRNYLATKFGDTNFRLMRTS